jgi:dTDP-6-deoxy-L-talose 4-dehydrogenase (NAD+)
MKKKVLVTGATGFVGNYVVLELLKKGYKVIATSRDLKKAEPFQWYPQVSYIPYDLYDIKGDLYQFFQKPDLLIHLAWEGLPNYKNLFHLEKNLFINYRFLKNMVKHGLSQLAVTGTCFEYGMKEGALNESLETEPNNSYGLAKDCLRRFLEQLNGDIDFDLKWIRLFYMYGEGQNSNAILAQLDKALSEGKGSFNMSGGEQLRDYLPVEKVAEYIVRIVAQDKITGIINCCRGKPISIRNLVENHLKKRKKSIHFNLGHYPYPDHEPMAFWGDNKKLMLALGKYYESD